MYLEISQVIPTCRQGWEPLAHIVCLLSSTQPLSRNEEREGASGGEFSLFVLFKGPVCLKCAGDAASRDHGRRVFALSLPDALLDTPHALERTDTVYTPQGGLTSFGTLGDEQASARPLPPLPERARLAFLNPQAKDP